MNKYLEAQGIVHTYSTAYTRLSNGRAERYNRTVLDKVRSMLEESGLPMRFWGEAVLHAAQLHNVTASAVLDNRTPIEVLFGYRPDVFLYSCIWLCRVYSYTEGDTRCEIGAPFNSGNTSGAWEWFVQGMEYDQQKYIRIEARVGR